MRRHLFLLLLLTSCAQLKPGPKPPVALTGKEEGLLRVAEAAEESGDTVGAERLYRQTMDLSKGSVDAHVALADMLLRQDKPEEAGKVLAQAAKVAPDDPATLGRVAKLALKAERPADALALYQRNRKLEPNEPGWFAGKGASFDALERHDDAQAVYRNGLKLAPKDERLLGNLGLSLALSGKADEAIALLEPHAKSAKSSAALRQNLALAYGVDGKPAKARTMLKGLPPEEIDGNLAFYERVREAVK